MPLIQIANAQDLPLSKQLEGLVDNTIGQFAECTRDIVKKYVVTPVGEALDKLTGKFDTKALGSLVNYVGEVLKCVLNAILATGGINATTCTDESIQNAIPTDLKNIIDQLKAKLEALAADPSAGLTALTSITDLKLQDCINKLTIPTLPIPEIPKLPVK